MVEIGPKTGENQHVACDITGSALGFTKWLLDYFFTISLYKYVFNLTVLYLLAALRSLIRNLCNSFIIAQLSDAEEFSTKYSRD